MKRCEYKLEQIVETFIGSNGVVRSARVKMAREELDQTVVKLVPVLYNGVSEIKNKAVEICVKSNQ